MHQVKAELANAYAQEFFTTVRDKCFQKCVTKPGRVDVEGGESDVPVEVHGQVRRGDEDDFARRVASVLQGWGCDRSRGGERREREEGSPGGERRIGARR